MDVLDQAISQKGKELEAYLARFDDPTLKQLLSDISALKRTRELVADMSYPIPTNQANQNGSRIPAPTLSQGDAAVEILIKAGRPMHLDEILSVMPQYGLHPKKANLESNIRKDRRERFRNLGGNKFALQAEHGTLSVKQAEHGMSSVNQPSSNGNGKGTSLPSIGFSLIGSIKNLLPNLDGEFSQPVIYNTLRELHPEVAPHIQKASVAGTLRKLLDNGLIEVTHEGFGSDPKRYKRKVD